MLSSQLIVVRWVEYALAGAILLIVAKMVAARLMQPADRINLIVMTFLALAVVVPVVGIAPIATWHLGFFAAGEQSELPATATLATSAAALSIKSEPALPPMPRQETVVTPAAVPAVLDAASPSAVVNFSQSFDAWRHAAIALAVFYLVAIGLLLTEWVIGFRALRRLARRARPAGDAVDCLWQQVSANCGIHVRVRLSPDITAPLVYGIMRPTILIPESMAAGDVAALRLGLAHEWSHIVNHDLRTWRLAWACQFLLWFQPMFWKLRRELRVCQDFLADQQAAGDEQSRLEYSELLLAFARRRQERPIAGAISFLDRSSQLARRIKMLVTSTAVLRSRSSLRFCVLAGVLSLIGSVLIGAVRLDSAQAGDEVSSASSSTSQPTSENNGTSGQQKPATPNEASEARTIRGRVVDATGKPVAGARIWLLIQYKPRQVLHSTSNDSGHFELTLPTTWSGLRPWNGNWTIWAYARGYSISTLSAYDVLQGKSNTELEFKLGPPSTCSFKVFTPTFEPLANALVQPQNYRTRAGHELVPDEVMADVSTRTGADGVANLSAVQPELLFRVIVLDEKLGRQSLRVDESVTDPIRVVQLRQPGRIEGRLVGGRPEWLRSVRLHFSTDNPRETKDTRGEAIVTTDGNGQFTVPAIANGGPLHNYVDLDRLLPVRPRLNDNLYIAPGETLQLEIPLVAAPKVYGKVLAKNGGKPVPNAWISLGYGGFHQSDNAFTDSAGRFEGRALPGPVRVQCISLPEGFTQLGEPWNEPFQVPPNVEQFELPTIEVVGTHELSGQLIGDKDQPLAAMQLIAGSGNRRYGYAATDAQGRFTMRVPDGVNTEIEVYLENRGQVPTAIIQKDPLVLRYVPDTSEQTFEKERAAKSDVTLTGRVLSDDRPLAGVELVLMRGIPVEMRMPTGGSRRGTSKGMRMEKVASGKTDSDGRYRLSGLKASDSYQLEVTPPFPASDPAWQHQSPWMPKLPDNATGEVALPDMKLSMLTQTLAGQVVDPDGKPVEGATVSAMLRGGYGGIPRTSRDGPPTWVDTGSDGRFTLVQLPDEPITIMAYINTHPKTGGPIRFPARVDVERNQQDIRIVLDPSLVNEEE